MHESKERGTNRDLRSSALWGTGGRGGDSRSSALWGKGGRGFVLTAVAVLALAVPFAASAGNGNGKTPPGQAKKYAARFVDPGLLSKAKTSPNEKVQVIIQSTAGTDEAYGAARGLGQLNKLRRLGLVNGVTVELPAKLVEKLSNVPGLTVTPDAPVHVTSLLNPTYTNGQLWPHANGDAFLWNANAAAPTIAVVDSGVDPSKADFNGRLLGNVNLSSMASNTPGTDGFGHGTFVAGIAAGAAANYAGAAPTARILSLDVINDQGEALTSDVITAADWILQNKNAYNIKVANFSLHSANPSNFTNDPLDQAVEKLWFSGVTVVAAAGNYGNTDGTPSGVRYAPGNDPFVITVGALDLGTSAFRSDDSVAPWSAYGYTYDGFWKPDVSAAGRYMIGPVPANSTLPLERPDKVTSPGYMELSGTSFSAPVVAGTAAELLALHPSWTPDQVKGALMMGALPIPNVTKPFQGGVGEINAVTSALISNPPNPNLALDRFVVPNPNGSGPATFDAVSWADTALSDVSWASVSWADVSWASVSWASVSWADVSWADVSWADMSTSDVSWADVSWADSQLEDAVASAPETSSGVMLTPDAAAALEADPTLNADPSLVDPSLQTTTATPTADSSTP